MTLGRTSAIYGWSPLGKISKLMTIVDAALSAAAVTSAPQLVQVTARFCIQGHATAVYSFSKQALS